MKRIEISDGIFLNTIPSEKYKTDYLCINAILPLKEETASLAALLVYVLKRGTENYPDMRALNKKLDSLYGTFIEPVVYKRGESQIVAFLCNFLKEEFLPEKMDILQEVIDIVCEILFCPFTENGAFSKEYVDGEKANLCDSINAQINNKNAYAIKRCHEEMCRGQNFAVSELGKIESVGKINEKNLYEFYKELLSRAKFEIFYTGSQDENSVKHKICKKFSVLKNRKIYDFSCEKFTSRENVNEVTEEMPVNQGKLVLGFSQGYVLPDSNYTKFALFNELFGGSATSKLFLNVREKLSLCYYCRSIPDAHKGILTVASGIEVENKEKAFSEICLQLENIKNGNISDEELEAARKSLINSYRELDDSAVSLSSWYLSRILAGNFESPEEVIENAKKVCRDDIVECAKSVKLDTVYFLKGTEMTKGGEDE